MVGQRVKCINDKNRPHDFPKSLWVTKDSIYTVSKVDKMHQMGGVLGVQLEEIDTTNNFPYTHFDINRFVPIDEDGPLTDDELDELLQEIEVHEFEIV